LKNLSNYLLNFLYILLKKKYNYHKFYKKIILNLLSLILILIFSLFIFWLKTRKK
jgi:hypothetical protein